MSAPYLTVVVPAYNEESRILPTLQRLHEYFSQQTYTWSVMVVSDGSSDKTNEIVAGFSGEHPEFVLNAYSPNRGKGYAVRHGILASEAEFVLFSDADLAAPIEEIEKLWEHKDKPVAIGSRPLKESHLEKRQPLYRELLGRSANKLIQVMAVPGIQDTQCGFKLFQKDAANQIYSRCKLNGFSFDFEALMIARDLGLEIAEVPIRWSHQEGSKVVLWRDVPKSLWDLFKLRLMGKKRRLELNKD